MSELTTQYRDVVQRLRDNFDAGATRPLKWRRGQLDAMRRLLEENDSAIADALHADLRKPAQEVVLGETALLFSEIRHARARMERWTRPRPVETPPITRSATSSITFRKSPVLAFSFRYRL